MTTVKKYVALYLLCLSVSISGAQENLEIKKDTLRIPPVDFEPLITTKLKMQKERIVEEERELLKKEIKAINKQLETNKITVEEAEKLKNQAAKKRASNIEDRIKIINTKTELLIRNIFDSPSQKTTYKLGNIEFTEDLGVYIKDFLKINDNEIVTFKINYNKPPKYDKRTISKLLFAIGFNNAFGESHNFDNTPYKIGGSGFVELGWLWQTRLSKYSYFSRINYGLTLQWNKLNINDNQYFLREGNQTSLQEFPLQIKKAKFRTTNLVFPIHFEFGPYRKIESDSTVRYNTKRKFKIGIGGFGGIRLMSKQKLVYKDENGSRKKDKDKGSFNTTKMVYGLSSYIGRGKWSLYIKYNLNPLFSNQVLDQHNISLGLRLGIH